MSDFTAVPDSVLEEDVEFDVMVTGFENGVEQRRLRSANPRRSFTLTFKSRTYSEMDTVLDFFISKSGNLSSFTWTNPNDSTEYTVRFAKQNFSFKRVGYDLYEFKVLLMEVRV